MSGGDRAGERGDLLLRDAPGRASADLLGDEGAVADESQHGHGADAEPFRGLRQGHLPALRHLTGAICRHPVLASEGTDPCRGPGVAAPGPRAEAIQRLGDGAISQLAGESADQVTDRRVRTPAMLPGSVAGDGEAGVITAPPVKEQFDVLRVHTVPHIA